MMKDLGLLVAAGGSARRYGGGNKLLLDLAGRPVFIHSFLRLGPHAAVRILAAPESEMHLFEQALKVHCPELPVLLVAGGSERSDSVRNALAALPEGIEYVAIHDAARPLATSELLLKCLARARETGAAIPGAPQINTLKRVDENGLIVATVDRERLFAVETPQVFHLATLRAAYLAAAGRNFTDDAAVMEYSGHPVAVVPHTDDNRKLTYPADFPLLEQAL